jgi:hypothetical protein
MKTRPPANDLPDIEQRVTEAAHMSNLIGAVWNAKVLAADAFRPMVPAFEPIVFADADERQAFGFAIKDLQRRMRELRLSTSEKDAPAPKPRRR